MTTNPQSPQGLPLAAAVAAASTDDDTGQAGPTVGASDAEQDAIRSGADTGGGSLGDRLAGADRTNATRDSDGVPVGEDDLEADKRNSGA
ncbi:hypothetical protein [Actinoplanes sp. N902-109]|uniref:hypothetical protein n=1 Tax=Actinoplanes sp. (strain N902-109) TaxID=649831 RepID=UPI00032962D1|nr:hypothetical protein [Actinoplanes sp. N902-109]AGL17116.1 hypothetical protein L083_3606 [Actinoplanes sp. N902-109]